MIVTRLMGGLGNQMFQYAAARALGLRHGVEVRVDLSYIENQHPSAARRAYALGCFQLEVGFATAEDLRWAQFGQPKGFGHARESMKTLLRPQRLRVVQQRGFGFDSRLLAAGPHSLLIGYWQSEDYFQDVRPAIKADFAFRNEPGEETRRLADAMLERNAVSLHVRRGDYVHDERTNAFHGALTADWYAAAAAEVATRVADPVFFVFSDDIDWCRRHLCLPYPVTLVERQESAPDHEDLHLMSLSRHHVVANSSFSWWGAWLGSDPGGVVVAPKTWFADAAIETSHVAPTAWVMI